MVKGMAIHLDKAVFRITFT